jgi:pyruvate dehydrogenase E2 component (dihydrolipoamide acetyltransferase)
MRSRALRIAATLTASGLAVLTMPLSAGAGAAGASSVAKPTFALAARVRPEAFDLLPRRATPPIAPPAAAAPVAAPAPLAAPARVAPAPKAATFPMVAGAEAVLVIPSIGLRLSVVLGGQATIDRGLVTHYEAND